ncbi:uncharacterized protein LOC123293064 [Chrysoperla carnea]|uniref:uncharacterized protein LOC123293064 n=1 Tax=Chrysoperla carnea TaxID=189513 RepID=UPI001D091F05|nr:uncharacterized protein LOC123293064 [Chrysoperla carnea]
METKSGPSSIEYIEDPYFNPQDSTATPSLDEIDSIESDDDEIETRESQTELDLFDYRSVGDKFNSLELNDDSLNIETEFYMDCNSNGGILKYIKVFRKDDKKQVRVIYSDLTKPFMAKMSNDDNFKNYLGFTLQSIHDSYKLNQFFSKKVTYFKKMFRPAEEAFGTGEDHFAGMNADEADRQRLIWEAELAKIEEEIATLRSVLASKVRTSNDLKRKLGITVWREISEDVNQGIKNVKESNVYQKTSGILSGITESVTSKIGQMRHSESFQKMGSAIENVKTKVTSRSSSIQSLDEAINQHQGAGSTRSSTATSPTIPENKPIV